MTTLFWLQLEESSTGKDVNKTRERKNIMQSCRDAVYIPINV